MNLNRWCDRLLPIALITGGIVLILIIANAIFGALFPEVAGESGLGMEALTGALQSQVNAISDLTGLSPLADLMLLAAGYVVACISLWLQSEIRTYLANRSHFR